MDLFSLLITLAAGAAGALIGSFVMWSFVGPRIVRKGIGPEIGSAIYTWLITPSIETGKMKVLTDEDGTESKSKEIISPMELLMSEAGNLVYARLMGKLGGDRRKKQVAQGDIVGDLQDPNNPFGQLVGGISPTLLSRAAKDGDYIPILLQMFQPQLEKFINGKLANMGNGAGMYNQV